MRDTARLIDVTDDLCEVLRFYKEGSAEVAARVEQGEPLADALKEAGGPIRRQLASRLANEAKKSLS